MYGLESSILPMKVFILQESLVHQMYLLIF